MKTKAVYRERKNAGNRFFFRMIEQIYLYAQKTPHKMAIRKAYRTTHVLSVHHLHFGWNQRSYQLYKNSNKAQ